MTEAIKAEEKSEGARVRPLEAREASWLMRPMYWATRRMFGKVLTPVKVQARTPGIAWFGSLFGMVVDKPRRLDARLHSLVSLRAAQMVGCPF